jgi:hypothetical protein
MTDKGDEKMTRTKNQRQEILDFLTTGHSLTSLEALEKFGCLRLASRISELRKLGHKIPKEMVTTENGACVARYYLIPDEAA